MIQSKIKKEEIETFEDEIVDFEEKKGAVHAAIGKNSKHKAKAFVLTTGTFLNGAILIGNKKREGGRIDEKKSIRPGKIF